MFIVSQVKKVKSNAIDEMKPKRTINLSIKSKFIAYIFTINLDVADESIALWALTETKLLFLNLYGLRPIMNFNWIQSF